MSQTNGLDQPPAGIFVGGTNTEVGKTFVACMIARTLVQQGRRVGVYKPVASGCYLDGNEVVSDDAIALWQAAGSAGELNDVCPQRFRAPLAPHLAAMAEGKSIDVELLRSGLSVWSDCCDVVIVEGAGGLMSPLGDDLYVADLAFEFGYPLVVVAPNVLGTINQTLQTLIAATTFRDGIEVAGIVLNDVSDDQADISAQSNYDELRKHSVPPVLASVPWGGKESLGEVDWYQLACGHR